MICPVCLGHGTKLGLQCGWCQGLGIERKISKSELLDFVKDQCAKNNFTIITPETATVETDGVECSAYFCAHNRVIVVAKHSVNFFENLLHEFCHLRQYQQQTKPWKDAHYENTDSSSVIADFITKQKDISVEKLKKSVDATIELEWECENMAISYLTILSDYSQERVATYKINAFVYMRFYRAVEHFGCWYKEGKNFLAQGIHHKYAESVKNMPNYNDPITDEEIEVMKECFV